MKNIMLIGWAAVVAVVLNYGIMQKEAIIRNGESIFLELAPVDPRSLMQGDFMRLNYRIANVARNAKRAGSTRERGHLVVELDHNKVAKFVRYHQGESLKPGETLIRYRRFGWRLRIVPNSFFFQEGHAKYYQDAKYGEFHVASPGKYVLVGLTDNNLKRLGASSKIEDKQ